MRVISKIKKRTFGVGTAIAAFSLVLAAFGSNPAFSAEKTVKVAVEPSAIPVYVANDRGFFHGINVKFTEVGYGKVQALLLSGDANVAWVSPIETIQFVSQGTPFKYFSTAGSQNMYNGVVVRTKDTDRYQSIADIKGKKLGIPGYGTGTWQAFRTFAKAFYGIQDPRSAFKIITADSGALLALLDKGDIDAALLFSGTSAAARALPQFHTIFDFTDAMHKQTGYPLTVNGSVATAKWLSENKKAAARFVEGVNRATQWIKNHPDAFSKGGKYANLAKDAGWLAQAETISTVQKLISEGKWYLSADDYTQGWIDAVMKLAADGKLVDQMPRADKVFLDPDSLDLSP